MTTPPRIIITGFMCAGKTTVARALAARLNCAWLDLDQFIAARTGRTVPAIIDADGEARFREIETEALAAALASDARIIALGGGAWPSARNRALVAQHDCVTVWLDAPFELCWQRIKSDQSVRPLARDPAAARARYDERRMYYQLARHHINAAQSVAEIVTEILTRL
ncbi:MAG: shikimate kinase [Acidobacteria bacterium]|nr:MAG: shikimate kinase [Acidobacteriota bacterium]